MYVGGRGHKIEKRARTVGKNGKRKRSKNALGQRFSNSTAFQDLLERFKNSNGQAIIGQLNHGF